MKKRLEAELISIAHRILKLKNKSEVDQLYKETQKLYETLSILKFYSDNFETVKAEIPKDVFEDKLENNQTKETIVVIEEITNPVSDEKIIEIIEEPIVIIGEISIPVEEEEEMVVELIKEQPFFKPSFELEIEEEIVTKTDVENLKETISEVKQISFEDFLGENYSDPVFVKPNEVSIPPTMYADKVREVAFEKTESKVLPLHESVVKSISIALNDRVAFVKNLFNDSNEDYNRVLSQLNTFDTFDEAKNFINEMVIPDYNYWIGKEEYIERFMEIVEKKFE